MGKGPFGSRAAHNGSFPRMFLIFGLTSTAPRDTMEASLQRRNQGRYRSPTTAFQSERHQRSLTHQTIEGASIIMIRAKLLAVVVGMLATLAVTAVPALAEFSSNSAATKGTVKVGEI